ncbi:carboxypeptidase-like regulatory domain-containing protein [Zobellia nedashkovskayae]
MKNTFIFLILLCCMPTLYSQDLTINGVVKDASFNEPLPGVSIIIKNTTTGTATDFEGVFSLKDISQGDILIFSYLGFITQEVTIQNSDNLTIIMQDDVSALEEVVVVGYGTQKVTKVSGAISTVKAEAIEKLKPLRVEEALQGSASGVSVIQSGLPGSKPTVLVRGIPSFSGVDPVVIIDGVPQSLDDLNSINSADIQSLNILKDAASTAIYGVKGGNGVIVVTTKGGRKKFKNRI